MEVMYLVKTKNLFLAGIIIAVCSGAIFILLTGSAVPEFTVKELMDYPKLESLLERKIKVGGIVEEVFNTSHFSISDIVDKDNDSLIIYIFALEIVDRPLGFGAGETVSVEGKILSFGEKWLFKGTRISSVCPTKYDG